MISEKCHVRPSAIIDPEGILNDIDKIHWDVKILSSRGREASKTMSPSEIDNYMEKIGKK